MNTLFRHFFSFRNYNRKNSFFFYLLHNTKRILLIWQTWTFFHVFSFRLTAGCIKTVIHLFHCICHFICFLLHIRFFCLCLFPFLCCPGKLFYQIHSIPLFHISQHLFSKCLSGLICQILNSLDLMICRTRIVIMQTLDQIFFFVISCPVTKINSKNMILFHKFLMIFSENGIDCPICVNSAEIF